MSGSAGLWGGREGGAASAAFYRWGLGWRHGGSRWRAGLPPSRAAAGPPQNPVPGRASPQAQLPAQARPGAACRASLSSVACGLGRARVGPKGRASARAVGPRATWPGIRISDDVYMHVAIEIMHVALIGSSIHGWGPRSEK